MTGIAAEPASITATSCKFRADIQAARYTHICRHGGADLFQCDP